MKWLTSQNNFNSNLKKQLLKVEDPFLFLEEWVSALSVTSSRSFILQDNYEFFRGVFSLWLFSSTPMKKLNKFLKSTRNCPISLLEVNHFNAYLSLRKKLKGIYEYYRQIFGDSEAYREISSKYFQNSIYDPVYISKRDHIPEEEARSVVNQTKNLTRGHLDRFILKYGEKEGTQKYIEFKTKCSNSLSSFQIRHPLDFLERYNLYCSRISTSNSLTSLSFKYGQVRAKEICLSKGRVFSQLVSKYGEEKATLIFNSRQKGKPGFSKASKSSIKFLSPLYDYLITEGGVLPSDIFWGVGSSSEYVIFHEGKRYYYDFTIFPLKVIIEFHGHRFHPTSPSSIWKHPYDPNITASEKYQYDSFKKELALSFGFKVITVFDNNLPKIQDLLKLIYEN